MSESVENAVVYLDYAATTPADPLVIQAMSECLGADGDFGNASSLTHAFGMRAQKRVEKARAQVAAFINAAPEDIFFTSGATESNNLAILGVVRANADRGRHIVTTRIEHKAVLDPCKTLEKEGFTVTRLTPDRSGVISPESVEAALRKDTVLVSVMYVNNEVGVIQDVRAISALCRARGIAFHTDAVQAAGRLPLDVHELDVDFLSFTAHKIYGPKGIGVLYVRRSARPLLKPLIFGGGQERGLRPGTLPTHQIAGLGVACELAGQQVEFEQARLTVLRDRLWSGLATQLPDIHLNAAAAPRVPAILNVSFEGVEGESLVTSLHEIAVSTGSACNSASGDPSYVLRALGRDTQLAQSSLRFSMGRFTRERDIDAAVNAVVREVRRLRELSPRSAAQGQFFDPATMEAAQFEVAGEAESADGEVIVRFHLLVNRSNVIAARFKAYGCPHTLKTVEWLTGVLPGRARDALVPDGPASWARRLAVPVEKLGRLLVVEDALRVCLQQWSHLGLTSPPEHARVR